MKELEISQDDIDVLWSAVINQSGVEKTLMNSAYEFEDFQKHSHRDMICNNIKDKLYNIGVTEISK